jgi:hypothetical protein
MDVTYELIIYKCAADRIRPTQCPCPRNILSSNAFLYS